MNAELKKRWLEVFSDEPGLSTVSAPAELFKPVEYLMKYIIFYGVEQFGGAWRGS